MINNPNKNLLIVDDEPNVISSLKRTLKPKGYRIYSAKSGMDGLKLLKEQDIGVALSDVMMPEMDGITFIENCRQFIKPDIVPMLLTAHASLDNAMDAINRSRIFNYLTKPWSYDGLTGAMGRAFEHYNLVMENKRLQQLTKEQNEQLKSINQNLENIVKKRTSQLEEAVREGVFMLAMAAEAKDDNTGEHVMRIRDLTLKICSDAGLSRMKSEEISFSSVMHDVGKIHIPDSILKKQGPLTDKEMAVMKTHCVTGEKILGNKFFYATARQIARSHHERWDGSGYPDGLKGNCIPLPARIVTVADVFDALTHARSYKPAWPEEKAINEMKKMSGKSFDPEILDVFLKFDTGNLTLEIGNLEKK